MGGAAIGVVVSDGMVTLVGLRCIASVKILGIMWRQRRVAAN